MKRLYYLTASLEKVDQVSNALHSEGVTDWNFHVLSKDQQGLHTRRINSVRYWQQSDLVHSAIRGAILGALICMALVFLVNFVSGYTWWSLPFVTVSGTLFGTWLGAFIGFTHENYKIARFHQEIESGKYLIMVDIHRDEEDRVLELMKAHHPAVRLAGEDSTLINPLKGHMGDSIA